LPLEKFFQNTGAQEVEEDLSDNTEEYNLSDYEYFYDADVAFSSVDVD
jgi:hypothetical protein